MLTGAGAVRCEVQRFLWVIAAALTFLLGTARGADACSCAYGGPPCQVFWSADAVFDGTVVDISPAAPGSRGTVAQPPSGDLTVSLDVTAAYTGASTGRLEVTTHSQSSACGYTFAVGERYLIFARRAEDGRLTVSACGATRKFDGTGPAAEFLASLAKPATGGRVFGTVTTQKSLGFGKGSTRNPLTTQITLRGPSGSTTAASSGGRYEFSGLAVGSYEIEVSIPEGYYAAFRENVEVENIRGCAESNVELIPNGRITGQLIDADGRGVGNFTLELSGADDPPDPRYGPSTISTWTARDGSFEFDRLSPGRYLLGVNLRRLRSDSFPYARTVFPGGDAAPRVIEVGLGQVLDLGTWQVPDPVAAVRISGQVLTRAGQPLALAVIDFKIDDRRPESAARHDVRVMANEDGEFNLHLRTGTVYSIELYEEGRRIPTSIQRIDTSRKLSSPLRLIVQR